MTLWRVELIRVHGGGVAAAIAPLVLLLDLLDEQSSCCVVDPLCRNLHERLTGLGGHRDFHPWSTGPIPRPRAKPPAIAPVT